MVKTSQQTGAGKGGFVFVNATSDSTPSRGHQRLVKSHVSRGRPRKRVSHPVRLRMTGRDAAVDDTSQEPCQLLPPLNRVELELALTGSPDGLRLSMVHTAVRFLKEVNQSLYPGEICHPVQHQGSKWVDWLMTDETYLHSILYASECYGNLLLGRDQYGKPAQYHLSKTLQLLRERISNASSPLAIANQTIMTVVVLAFASEVLGENSMLVNHLEGLARMVGLRGGFGRVDVESDMLASKICRVDLGAALRFDRRPMFFTRNISWDPYFDASSAPAPGQMSGPALVLEETDTLMQSLDWRLLNVWQDMKHLSYLCTLACSTGYKLSHQLYSDIMSSVLYRLLHMTLDPDRIVDSAIRLTLVALASDIFVRWQDLRRNNAGAIERLGDALEALRTSAEAEGVPKTVLLWMLLLWHVLSDQQPEPDTCWLSEMIGRRGLSSWQEARQIVKTMGWVDFLHDAKGKVAFEASLPSYFSRSSP